VTGRKIFLADPNGERTATPRHDALIVKAEAQASKRGFQTRGRIFIASQRIRDPQRMGIQGTADRNSRLSIAHPTPVLDRGKKAGRTDKNFH
jgi:hypothetical protein